MISKKELKTDLYLILAAALWGLGFVAQRQGMDHMGPFFYSAARFTLGTLFVGVFYFLQKRHTSTNKGKRKDIVFSGLIVGVLLFLAVNAQQIGLVETSAGKAGFITSLYMVFVPLFGLFIGMRARPAVIIGIVLALSGLYFMSISGDVSIGRGDIFIFVCAILWAVHFLFIAHYAKKVDAILLSIMQFAVCAVLSFIVACLRESMTFSMIQNALPAILYGGIGSVGIAYTLHVVALKTAEPAYASLILSTESVFGALGGRIILGEIMSPREILGAVLIMGAIVFVQVRKRDC